MYALLRKISTTQDKVLELEKFSPQDTTKHSVSQNLNIIAASYACPHPLSCLYNRY